MLSKVAIKNYKSLRDVQIDLERFTVFVGPNASGKSSILQALDLLCRTYRMDHPKNMEGEITQGLSRGAAGPVTLAVEDGGQWFRYQTHPPGQPNGEFEKYDGSGRSVSTDSAGKWKGVPNGSTPLPQSVFLRLEASKLSQSRVPQADPTEMAQDGAGLHSALANIALSDPETWQVLQEQLRRILPTVRRLRHTMKGPNGSPVLLFDMHGADSLTADQVSEGTLLVLGLLAALHAPAHPNLILLDDIDRGLHPRAQTELISLLRELEAANPALQVIATTHSPYLLDGMEPREVRITMLRDDGTTECAALAEHPEFEKWKDEMTPGEMWSVFGEKWVAEGVPA